VYAHRSISHILICGSVRLFGPIFNFQSLNLSEFHVIIGNESQILTHGMRRNEQVKRSNWLVTFF
jgi:hypothetical protein